MSTIPIRYPGTEIDLTGTWHILLNGNQNLLGKLMLVLSRPCESVADVSPEEWIDLHHQIKRAAAALDAAFSPDLLNYAFLMNFDAQVHLHVVPRYREPRVWDGLTFDDPHFGSLFGREQRFLSDEQNAELSALIRSCLDR